MSVLIYALSTCIHCRNTRAFLDEEKVEYEAVEVDQTFGEEREKVLDEVRKFNPELSFPTVVIDGGEKVIVGFKRDELKEALNL